MNARYYVPNTNRFLTPDSIVPDPTNPQSFNRYSYVNNNPVRFTDPSGHCIFGIDTAVCVSFLIGAGVALIVDYTIQVADNYENGMVFWDAVYKSNINWSQTAGSAAAGGVGGAISAPIAGFAGASLISRLAWTGLGGAIGGTVGGQTGNFVEATVSEVDSYYEGFGFSQDRLFQNASQNGFLDPNDMLIDAASGTVLAWAGEGLKSVLNPKTSFVNDRSLTPMIKMEPVLGKGVQTQIIYYDGKVITMNPSQTQAFMQALSQGSRDAAADLITEWFGTQVPDE